MTIHRRALDKSARRDKKVFNVQVINEKQIITQKSYFEKVVLRKKVKMIYIMLNTINEVNINAIFAWEKLV